MGLFERKSTPITASYFSIGNERTSLVVGLGNVGKKYDLTRHNAGFMCVDYLTDSQESKWKVNETLKCLMTDLRLGDKRVIVIKPTTLMNLSGDAVQAVKKFYMIDNKDILVVHDELALPFGSLRFRVGGSSAGNNGIKSVSAHIGEDYARLRIGITNENKSPEDAAKFVLKKFNKEEQSHFKTMLTEVNALITEFIYSENLQSDTRRFI